jgi:hypothetical protein
MKLSTQQLNTQMLPQGSSEGSFVSCHKPEPRYDINWVSGRSKR